MSCHTMPTFKDILTLTYLLSGGGGLSSQEQTGLPRDGGSSSQEQIGPSGDGLLTELQLKDPVTPTIRIPISYQTTNHVVSEETLKSK